MREKVITAMVVQQGLHRGAAAELGPGTKEEGQGCEGSKLLQVRHGPVPRSDPLPSDSETDPKSPLF